VEELTLDKLNFMLGKAKVAELSRDKVYLLCFDRMAASDEMVMNVVGALAQLGIESVAVRGHRQEPLQIFTLEQKKPLDKPITPE
jgi:hypothetical protein